LALRQRPGLDRPIRIALATWVVGAGLGFVVVEAVAGVSWRWIAPLHLCDLAIFVAAWALLRRNRVAAELTYFWGLAGTLPAMVTPDLFETYPHHRFLFYFGQHGAIVVTAIAVAAGLGMSPRKGGVWRAWLWLNAVAIGVGAFDFAFDTNFLYLREKPPSPTPLDWFGPWPYYILGSELLALGLFFLLDLPFRAGRRAEAQSPGDW
jgi:hypothetical integral membrane protein (TIGR02206 family)